MQNENIMVIVLFEVVIKKEYEDAYLAVANSLKNELAKAKGFIRGERFSSFTAEGKLLSLSVWESEQAVENWRNQQQHRIGQQCGRNSMFEGYTITVLSTIRSYTDICRDQAPDDSNKYLGIFTK